MEREVAVMYFRRDLRLSDNTALNAALATGHQVACVFVVDPRQIGETNAYRSIHALQFMHECLQGVDNELKEKGSALSVLYGLPEEELVSFAKQYGARAVFFNNDYTPFSEKRDVRIRELLAKDGIEVRNYHDALLTPPGIVHTEKKEPYKVFTPFYRAAQRLPIAAPETFSGRYFPSQDTEQEGMKELSKACGTTKELAAQGGRKNLHKRIQHLRELRRYRTERDFPARSATSLLSPYLKFGVISPREAFNEMKKALPKEHEALVRQLYWRDFFTHLGASYPHVYGSSFNKQYDQVRWETNATHRSLWERGMTGFPIVDAGMRQLSTTGWMHNRVRMIVASFLTKDLHIDWREGERYFASQLIDYDPAVNNGSWQWVAGTGADAQPWFRIFNPWLQQKKFDKECAYIRRFIPELQDVPAKDIHGWHKKAHQYTHTGYPAPMVDHGIEAKKTLALFQKATKRL